MPVEDTSYTKKEIGQAINNALVAARGAVELQNLPESRWKKLRSYMEASLAAHRKHVGEELLSPEELVYVLQAATLMAQATLVMNTGRLMMFEDLSKRILEDGNEKEKSKTKKK